MFSNVGQIRHFRVVTPLGNDVENFGKPDKAVIFRLCDCEENTEIARPVTRRGGGDLGSHGGAWPPSRRYCGLRGTSRRKGRRMGLEGSCIGAAIDDLLKFFSVVRPKRPDLQQRLSPRLNFMSTADRQSRRLPRTAGRAPRRSAVVMRRCAATFP